ncbi:hypothetical protein FGO68_gene913 [Halteria grandinella]|uniref:non-specific serine/threonine protein kinase n=1 Tax=Halteria grandinella TaxID=5974 RepID=A0A8J8NZM3_HALGN|nr:hypothetical protein FGO68_gene913 [Halteria grandinella]
MTVVNLQRRQILLYYKKFMSSSHYLHSGAAGALPESQQSKLITHQSTMSDFVTLGKLGTGAFSEVFRVRRKTDNIEYALKKVKLGKLNEKEKENALNEVRILASIEHPNIVGYKEAFFEESTQTLCIVMEFADGGDLQTKINQMKKEGKHIKEQEIWSIFYQMVVGLQTLHNLKIVHRDIKCANVFLTKQGIAKMGDLNVSKIAKMGVLQTQTGTPYYASPEVWQDKPYDKRSDIWSLGCVLYELTALSPPFTAKDMQGLYKAVLKGVYPRIPAQFSADLAEMLRCLLQVDPKNRPTTTQILQMPILIQRTNMLKDVEVVDIDSSSQLNEEIANMLGTIRLPKNLRLLSERLPKSNYGGGAGAGGAQSAKKKKSENKLQESTASSSQQISQQKSMIENGPKEAPIVSSSELLALAMPPARSQTKNVKDELHAILEEELLTPSIQQEIKNAVNNVQQQISAASALKQNAPVSRSDRRIHRPMPSTGALMNQLIEKSSAISSRHKVPIQPTGAATFAHERSSIQHNHHSVGQPQSQRPVIPQKQIISIDENISPNNNNLICEVDISQNHQKIIDMTPKLDMIMDPPQPLKRPETREDQISSLVKVQNYRRKRYVNQGSPTSRNQGEANANPSIESIKKADEQAIQQAQQSQREREKLKQLQQNEQKMVAQPSAPLIKPPPQEIADLVSYEMLNRKLAEANIIAGSPDLIKRKEQMIRKNYYRQYISRQDSASQRRIATYERPLIQASVQTPQSNGRMIQPPVNQYYGRQIFSSQSTPKYNMISRLESRGQVGSSQNLIVNHNLSTQEREQIAAPRYSNGAVAGMAAIQRTRSKDSIQISNNLRDLYKHYAGAQNVIQHGRIDSQRLLMENYKKLDPINYGYLLNPPPINLKKQNQMLYHQLPASHQGQRNLAIQVNPTTGGNYYMPPPSSQMYRQNSKNYISQATPAHIHHAAVLMAAPQSVQNQNLRPQWWG